MAVHKKEDIPDNFYYKHNVRIMPIIIEVKEGWTIVQNKTGPFMCEYFGNSVILNHFPEAFN